MRVGSLMKEFSGTVWPDLCLTVYEVQDAVVDKRRSLALWQPVPADYGHLAKVTYIPSHNAAAILFLRRPSTSMDINDQRQGSLDSNSDDRNVYCRDAAVKSSSATMEMTASSRTTQRHH
ncbi:uncharacterized protein [Haliotis cracherodii]|uniref:uncharacterized protein n=1 Tax=Haliotis cracherodii TaxID=6455 RepID=UPI0039EC62FB